MTIKGKFIASSVAGLLLCAAPLVAIGADPPAKVKCTGINACKGKGGCKSTDNACKGKNGCKGKGWTETATEKECTDKGGKVVKEAAK